MELNLIFLRRHKSSCVVVFDKIRDNICGTMTNSQRVSLFLIPLENQHPLIGTFWRIHLFTSYYNFFTQNYYYDEVVVKPFSSVLESFLFLLLYNPQTQSIVSST